MFRVRSILFICPVLQLLVSVSVRAEDCLLYSVRMDGTGLRLEVEADLIPEYSVYGSPDISPDGKRLIFDATPVSVTFHQAKILVMEIAGQSKGEVADLDCGNCPVWSPDGKRITFSVNPSNPNGFAAGVWIMNADGSDPKWICQGRMPRWTPDGKSLVIVRRGLEKIDLETKEAIPFLAAFSRVNPQIRTIRWSPDGKRILAYIRRPDENQLVTISTNEAEDTAIVLATGELDYAVYSTDGEWVSFVRNNDQGGNDIYVVAVDGKSEPKKLNVVPAVSKEDFCWMKVENRILFNAPGRLPVEVP